MLIAAAPVAIPVTTANPPTEAVAREVAQKTPVPEPTSATDSAKTKNGTESNEQPKNVNEQTRQQSEKNNDNDEQSSQQEQQQKDQQQQREIAELRRTDRSVRAHEQAHANAGGSLAGAPRLTFETGPDGKRYAVAGEVSIDTGKVANDPQATIDKMLQVQRAALAPANPSTQDLKVAAIANQVANQARVELELQPAQDSSVSPFESSNDSEQQENEQFQSAFVANPVAARRASLSLNQKIVDSGALDNPENEQRFTHTA